MKVAAEHGENERGNHKREKKQMGGGRERQKLYLNGNMKQMQSPLVTHLVLALCVCLMSIAAEALGFLLSTITTFLDFPISLSN